MVHIGQLVLSFLSLHFPGLTPVRHEAHKQISKSIAIVGAGSAGLPMLKALLDLPLEVRGSWEINLYEQRGDVAGVWLPQPNPPSPPEIPYTPLYIQLRTNTPVPSMTYPGLPFPPGTALFPSHEHIQAYHKRYAVRHNLEPYIKTHHSVLSAEWIGDSYEGYWNITIRDGQNRTIETAANHLIVAAGNFHTPRKPAFNGQEEWLKSVGDSKFERELFHSVYYRSPKKFIDRTLLVIGAGSSGQDIALQSVGLARKTYISIRHPVDLPPGSESVVVKPEISHFTPNGIVFVDGTELRDVDIVVAATGYEQRVHFLEAGNALIADPSARSNSSTSERGGALITNLRYIFPLYRHILAINPKYPVTALSFIGLPSRIANCPSDYAQSLFVAHSIANPSILASREELLGELALQEENIRRQGVDPYRQGHALLNGTSSDYQDELVDFLKKKNVIVDDGKKYVEGWRRDIFSYVYLRRGWKRIEALGQADQWVAGVETEEQWSNLMKRVNAWQERYEKENGIPFVYDLVADS